MSALTELLERSGDLLRGHFTKGAAFEIGATRSGMKWCSVGALLENEHPGFYRSVGGPVVLGDLGTEALVVLSEVIREQFPDRVWATSIESTVVHFNDHPDTTEQDVVAVFEKARVRAEERV